MRLFMVLFSLQVIYTQCESNSTSPLQDLESDLTPLTSSEELTIPHQTKRVFLSRGWGPGGYEVVEQLPPHISKFRDPPSRPIRKPKKPLSKPKPITPITPKPEGELYSISNILRHSRKIA